MLGRKQPEESSKAQKSKQPLRSLPSNQAGCTSASNQPGCTSAAAMCHEPHEQFWGNLQRAPQARAGKTRVLIRYDVGFSNSLCIRGKGAPGLSWERGTPLRNIRADLWVWECDAPFTTAEFKILVNDCLYEEGENHSLRCGAQVEYTPHFAHAHA